MFLDGRRLGRGDRLHRRLLAAEQPPPEAGEQGQQQQQEEQPGPPAALRPGGGEGRGAGGSQGRRRRSRQSGGGRRRHGRCGRLAAAPEGHQRLAVQRIEGGGVRVTRGLAQQLGLSTALLAQSFETPGQFHDGGQALVQQLAHLARFLRRQLGEGHRLAAQVRVPLDDVALGLPGLGEQGRRARRQVAAQDGRQFRVAGQGIGRAAPGAG
ncbi:hypothetical protein ACFS3C_26630 [Azotobacter vinelandii]